MTHKKSACALVLVWLIGAGALMPHLGFNFSLAPLIIADGEKHAEVMSFQDEVPPALYDQLFLLEFPQVMGSAELEVVKEWTARMEASPHVASVRSLGEAWVVEPVGNVPVPRPFWMTVGEGESVLEAARRHPLLEGRLLSHDGRSATFLVSAVQDDEFGRGHLLEWLEAQTAVWKEPAWSLHFIGTEVSKRAVRQYMGDDLKRSLLLELLAFSILLPLIFRTLRGIVIPIAVVLVAQLSCGALLVLAGMDIGLIDIAVPGIITMITLCDAVHMLHSFEDGLLKGRTKTQAIAAMVRSVGPACLYTSLTTGVGFLSLVVAPHPAVRVFGVKASLAVGVAFLAVMTIVPIALALWPVQKGAQTRLPSFLKLSYGKRKLTFAIFGAGLALALLGVSRLRVDSHWLEEFPQKDPMVSELAWFEKNFAGLMNLDLRVQGDLDSPAVFAALEKLQADVLAEPDVTKVESYTHWLREARGHPDVMDQMSIEQAFGLLATAPGLTVNVVNPDRKTGRVRFWTEDRGTSRFFELRERIDELSADLPQGTTVEVAGFMEMVHETSRLVVTTMLYSFLVSLLTISILVALLFRSLRIGLLSIVPNGLPVLVALGITGWLGIPLRVGIVMIYSLGLGLAVDDTIHLITRYRQELSTGVAPHRREVLLRSLRGCGPALVTTSIILAVGSLCNLPSDFQSLQDVGILLTAMVITALAADLWLFPHLLEKSADRDWDTQSAP